MNPVICNQGRGGAGHRIGAPIIFLGGIGSRIVSFFVRGVISGGTSGMESKETCTGRWMSLRFFLVGGVAIFVL